MGTPAFGHPADRSGALLPRSQAPGDGAIRGHALLLLILVAVGCGGEQASPAPPALSRQTEAEIRAADGAERLAMLHADTDAQAAIWADEFVVTNTFGEVLTRREVLEVFEAGIVPYSTFERTVEDVRVYGDVAASLGSETVVPTGPDPERIARRYTHVWVSRDGTWQLVARHAVAVR